MSSFATRRLRTLGPPMLAVLVAAAAIVAGLAIRQSATEQDDLASATRDRIHDVRIVESSKTLVRVVYGELVARIHADLDPAANTAVDGRERSRIEEGSELISLLAAIGDDDTLRAADAQRALDEIQFSALLDTDPSIDEIASLLGLLFDVADAAESDVRSGTFASELFDLAALPVLIGHETVIALVATTDATVTPAVGEYVDENWRNFADAPGWLGPSGEITGPFAYFDAPVARDRAPDVVQGMDSTLSSSGLVPVDVWLHRLVDGPEPLPIPLGDVVSMIDRTEAELSAITGTAVDIEIERLESDLTQAEDEATRLTRVSTMLFVIAAIAAIVATGLVAVAIVRSFQRARLASVDQLTGIGNRHVLDDETAVLLADKRLTEHAVAVVDCDRFKMFNDLYGHDAGDRILVEIATRLEASAALLRSRHHARTTLVRLGGDEFLLSVHARSPIDADDVREVLTSERHRTFSLADGSPIDLEFSIGVVTTSDPASLADLMHQADLAVYEDKAARRSDLADLPTARSDSTG